MFQPIGGTLWTNNYSVRIRFKDLKIGQLTLTFGVATDQFLAETVISGQNERMVKKLIIGKMEVGISESLQQFEQDQHAQSLGHDDW